MSPLTGALSWWLLRDPDAGEAGARELPQLPAGASPARLALPYASDPLVTLPDGSAAPIVPPDPALYARACLRLSSPGLWELETFDGESGGLAFCLTQKTGTFVVVTYPISSASATPTPAPTASPSWAPPLPSSGFVVGSGTPPFAGDPSPPQLAFYILFDGFPDFVAFENAGGRLGFEDDLRAFFLSSLPWSPDHLLQRLFIFEVRTGDSGTGALVGAAVEFISGADAATAALLLQKTTALLTQPWLVFSDSSFYGGGPTAVSATAYGPGAVDPALLSAPSSPPTTPPATTAPPPTPPPATPATSPWVPPPPTGGFVVGAGTPPFGAGTTTPQLAFYMLFDGFADSVAFENAGGRLRFEDDLRAFFLSPLPWDPNHLLQRLFIFDVRTGASGSGALVGAAVEFIGGAQGAQAALLLQKTAQLLSQPSLVFGSSSSGFYGRPSALSVTAYGDAVDPSAVLLTPLPTGSEEGGSGSGSGGSGSGSGETKKGETNAGAVAGGVVGGIAALALLAFVFSRLLLRRRGLGSPSSASAPLSPPPPQQFIANAAADPTRPQAAVVSQPPPPPPAAGSSGGGGNGLEAPLVA